MDKETCQIVSENDPSPAAGLHCVLVHGTFARDARWTFPDSPFATGLRSLDSGGVQFHRFCWSGDNTHNARCVAAAELRSRLRELAAQYPNARFLLVGHSHGGNIASAAASALQGAQCAGIVALATPFFHVAKRSLAPAALLPALLCVLIGASLMGYGGSWIGDLLAKANHWLYGYWAEALGKHWLYHIHSGIVAIAGLLGFGGGLLFIGMLLYTQAMDRLSARQNIHLRVWDQLRPFAVSTLSLSMTLDEVFWGLSWARRLPERLHQVREWIHRHLVMAITMITIPMSLIFVVIYIRTTDVPIYSDAVAPRALVGLAWAVAAGYVLMITLWLLVVLLTYILLRVTYGLDSVEHHLMVNVTVRRTPQIAHPSLVSHENIALPLPQLLSEKLGLIHSKLYIDPRSTEEIIRWYRKLPHQGSYL